MVIRVRQCTQGTEFRVQDEIIYVSLYTNAFEKGMNPLISPTPSQR